MSGTHFLEASLSRGNKTSLFCKMEKTHTTSVLEEKQEGGLCFTYDK